MKDKCKNGCWKIFMKWVAEWTTTGHNVWSCSSCGRQNSFERDVDPNKLVKK